MRRVGLGRHGQLDADGGDPLDGLVNLFDVGMVLAVAFLIAGLGMSRALPSSTRRDDAAGARTTVRAPSSRRTASGRGRAVGQVYQLPDGTLVLVDPAGR
ncbi:DUF2149 domain-containing protein [Conexibacter sp. JD483]|uniref:DUF2149 domain-containing protein n=1 Tax=unclassified Conexibacter TaxID=2627773 RepID=UPI002720AD0F|nr:MULTISPECIES: DUF2149 domain-containing protein [unclassified Conexibacter]MDO8187308.1 DUF2149 domain-containing protein [Conexibacter sp. CPCC 205706]MDO8200559.1 DUF2149 domain-containing protein [Conexibacter sp. CPCC 205762]MDR9369972.1 DUF2149 domain-containing protein [Conexibacter sp. JD483]